MRERALIAKERRRIHDAIRGFFDSRDYLEVEVPILVRSPGMEPNLMPFETALEDEKGTRFKAALSTSPEYGLKKLLGAGMERIYAITKSFRNGEPFDETHNSEFTMLEWYRQGGDYKECMDETEALIRHVAHAAATVGEGLRPSRERVGDSNSRNWMSHPFKRLRIRDLMRDQLDVDLDTADAATLKSACVRHGLNTVDSDTESDLFYRLFVTKIEPNLPKEGGVFIYDYPKSQAALSRTTPDGKYGERFELYINGLEFCNAFTELVDADEQRRRFEEEALERRAIGKTVHPIDEELLALLPSIHSPTYGNALGIDRLHMLVYGLKRIDDVLLFPTGNLFVNKEKPKVETILKRAENGEM